MYQKWIKNLNKEQKKIVEDQKNSIYVLAGAGTGKTKTLTSKIIFLLKKLNIKKENILAITFTNNAAQEMKNRLQEILKEDFSDLNVETFHSLSNKILKKYKNKEFFSIVDEQDSKNIIKEQIKEHNFKTKFSINQIKNCISLLKTQKIKKKIMEKIKSKNKEEKNKNFSNKDFIQNYEFIPNYEEIKNIYKKYQNFLIKNNLMDFDDLIINNYQLLKKEKLIAEFYQKKFIYILVDEFQDIDIIQYQIIKILGKNNILFVVGDPNQNIYNFRGSDIICSHLFLKDFRATIYRLFKNYRSTQNILSKSNLLIQNNCKNEKIFQNKLESVLGPGKKVFYKNFFNSSLESEFITKEITKIINTEKYFYKDVAILYRINELRKEIENKLIIHNIPYQIQDFISFYNKKDIKVFINYLKALINPKKDFYLKKIINIPARKIGTKTIKKLEEKALDKNISLFEVINDEIKNKSIIGKKVKNFQEKFQEISIIIQNPKKCQLSNIIFLIDNIIQYSSSFSLNKKSNQEEIKIKKKELEKNLIRLQNIFAQYKFTDKIDNLLDKVSFIIEQINLYSENEIDNNKNKILLSSIHKVKGLEFKIVFFIGLEEKTFLSQKNNFINNKNNNYIEKEIEIEEERRLAYVAITRAKELLYITSSQNRFLFGQKIISEPICFIKEMNLDSYKKNNYLNIQKLKKIESNFYQIADNVKHNKFGIGKIVEINKDIATISFLPPHGIKKILIYHSSLQKVIKK